MIKNGEDIDDVYVAREQGFIFRDVTQGAFVGATPLAK